MINTSDAIKYIYYSENFYLAYLEEYRELSVRVLFPFIINTIFLVTNIDVEIIFKVFAAIIFILTNLLTLNFLKKKFDNYIEILFWYIFLIYSNINLIYCLYNPFLLGDIFIYLLIISFITFYDKNYNSLAFICCAIAPFAKEYFLIFSILGIYCLYTKNKNKKIIYYFLFFFIVYFMHYYFAGSQYIRTEKGFVVFIDLIFNKYLVDNFIYFFEEKIILFYLIYICFFIFYWNKIDNLKPLILFSLFLFLITSFNYEKISGSNYFRIFNPGLFLLVLIILFNFKMKEIELKNIIILLSTLLVLFVEYSILFLTNLTNISGYFFSNRISNILFINFNLLVLIYFYLKKRSMYV